QLHVRFPESSNRPACFIALEQVGAIPRQRGLELWNVPRPAQLGPLRLADHDRYKGAGLGISTGEPPHTFQDLIAVLEPPCTDNVLEALQTARQPTTLTAANGTFLLTTRTTTSQEKMLPLPANQLDGDLGIPRELLPALALQLALKLG